MKWRISFVSFQTILGSFTVFTSILCINNILIINGIKGFEPLNDRTKNDRLSTWLYSTIDLKKSSSFY